MYAIRSYYADLRKIEETIDGSIGRPHIADYLVKKNIVKSRQDAFDKYLVKCDVPKFPRITSYNVCYTKLLRSTS